MLLLSVALVPFTSARSYISTTIQPRQNRRSRHHLPVAAVVVPPVLQNLARGSVLKCLADLTGGLPLEVWKSSVVLENLQQKKMKLTPRSSMTILKSIIHDQGITSLWSGLTPRMVEGIFSGGVLLSSKELLHTVLSNYVSPVVLKRSGLTIPPSAIGFVSGAGGGMAQALVMGPTSLIVTACVSAQNDGEPKSAFRVAQDVVRERGVFGLYRGAPAVAYRQATNWASRQGFTEWIRPRIPIQGIAGELLSGCLGGVLSAWNTPFEVARIESQSKIMGTKSDVSKKADGGKSLLATMNSIVQERGVGGLYVGLVPRAAQACYQTLFLVCVPRLIT